MGPAAAAGLNVIRSMIVHELKQGAIRGATAGLRAGLKHRLLGGKRSRQVAWRAGVDAALSGGGLMRSRPRKRVHY